jgi:sulfur carrier protein
VADALAQMQAKPPFAVAVNTVFVPRTQYADHALNEGDRMEVISPVTGG